MTSIAWEMEIGASLGLADFQISEKLCLKGINQRLMTQDT